MTLSTETRVIRYAGDDNTTVFPYPFRIFEDADLQVYITVDATGVETLKTLTTHYTVSNAGEATGGNVTMLVAPATGETLTIARELDIVQETDYVENDPFPAETHEDALDRAAMIDQQLQEKLTRTVTIPISDDTASMELPNKVTRADSYLYFDSNGEPTSVTGTTEGGDHGGLGGLSDDDHTQYHNNTRGDVRYYTKSQTYTQAETDAAIGSAITTISGQLDDHNELNNLDYASAGHTGFASSAQLTTTSGDIISYVDSEVATVTGTVGVTGGDSHDHSGGDGAQIDHGGLAGKGDDDHTQYLLANGSRQLSSDWAFGSDTISGSGRVAVGDHAAATIPSTVNVIYGTGDPPGAGGYPEGTLYIKYVA